jgi:RHS repeat-associated protein
MAGISDKAIKTPYTANKYRYNGKELQNNEFYDGSGLEEYDYGARFYDGQIGRWFQQDELSTKETSISPYSFDFGNPISLVDMSGKWPTPVHHQLLQDAFGKNSYYSRIITPAQLSEMMRGSDIADGIFNGNQDDSRQFIHGMKVSTMSVEESIKASNDWITARVKDFVETGDWEKLGEGLHTIMDITSPAHRDENGIPQEYDFLRGGWDHHQKEDPDWIKANDGKHGFITVGGMKMRWEFAQANMFAVMDMALAQRKKYLSDTKKKNENNEQRAKINEVLNIQRQERGSILGTADF